MGAQLVLPSYLEPYVQRLYDARHTEFRGMTNEALRLAVGEALEVVCASAEEIETVTWKLSAKLRDDSVTSWVGSRQGSDDGLFR